MFTGLFINAFIISPYVDLNNSEMDWNIAGGASPISTPNILSELQFEDIESIGYGINLAHLHKLNENLALYLEIDYSDSSIDSGNVQDSDYFGNNRTNEFSRSTADVDDDSVNRLSIGAGLKTRWFNTKGHYFTGFVGFQQHDMNYTMTNGVQHIPEEFSREPIEGLNSTYDSEYESWFIRLGTEHVFSWGTIGFSFEHHDLQFSADADWSLRDDFAHPKSFAHKGNGYGNVYTFAYTYPIKSNCDIYVNFTRREYSISNGYDQTFFSDGNSTVVRLNEVNFESDQTHIGFRYIF